MAKSRSEQWNVWTAEGRDTLERFLAKHYPDMAIFPVGWIYTGDGMVALKKWAAQEKGIIISSSYADVETGASAEAGWMDEFGSDRVYADAPDEPTAVALALARALEEMER